MCVREGGREGGRERERGREGGMEERERKRECHIATEMRSGGQKITM